MKLNIFTIALVAILGGCASPPASTPSTASAIQVSTLKPAYPSGPATGTGVQIQRDFLGSGVPGSTGNQDAWVMRTDPYGKTFMEPQYLPYFPTAATIWPRVVEVPCIRKGQRFPGAQPGTTAIVVADLVCQGYHTLPSMGRGEYLYFTPKFVDEPQVVERIIQAPARVIIKEVPAKRGRE